MLSTMRLTIGSWFSCRSPVSVMPHIVQITAGPHANIVTEDGQRLFVGDERNGLRLTGITADSVQFGGKENIAVKW